MPALTVLRQCPRTFLLTAAAVPLALAAVVDDVRVRRQLEAARRDQLTGLPCRDGLTAHGKRQFTARRRAGDLLVLVLDGNGFKAINDSFGHAAGDKVVVTLAQRLRQWSAARQGLAARLGGDEFGAAVCVPREHFAQELAGLRFHMDRPVPYEGLLLPFTVSIGAAHTVDLPGRPFGDVLRSADVSMYKVKAGEEPFPYLGTEADAEVKAVNGRRPGRPGTALPERAA
ncbi:GGDEF domain-containing protein [Streptomyces sp. GS7]|uniref:GGDEF domain-containing protein n=1 Tax=Streptomyces sp. GS7 TaxID=2692234 RepID=UPI0013163B8E|nr:GGDEF domain-containing protein [Streptomyces sp. GS7]QHC23227.1 diguanylate cyclase [Streptomyces sp. GS7]